jgi:hypothetical protein
MSVNDSSMGREPEPTLEDRSGFLRMSMAAAIPTVAAAPTSFNAPNVFEEFDESGFEVPLIDRRIHPPFVPACRERVINVIHISVTAAIL